jgi:hypothetical protein
MKNIKWVADYHMGTQWGELVETERIFFEAPANFAEALKVAEGLIPEGSEIENMGCM